MIEFGEFKSHSGVLLPWKINCDSFTDDDWSSVAKIVASKLDFSEVRSVPGANAAKFAKALVPYATTPHACKLLVDDVLTTGKSMEYWRDKYYTADGVIVGAVVFARNSCPGWIFPVFNVSEYFQ